MATSGDFEMAIDTWHSVFSGDRANTHSLCSTLWIAGKGSDSRLYVVGLCSRTALTLREPSRAGRSRSGDPRSDRMASNFIANDRRLPIQVAKEECQGVRPSSSSDQVDDSLGGGRKPVAPPDLHPFPTRDLAGPDEADHGYAASFEMEYVVHAHAEVALRRVGVHAEYSVSRLRVPSRVGPMRARTRRSVRPSSIRPARSHLICSAALRRSHALQRARIRPGADRRRRLPEYYRQRKGGLGAAHR